MTGERRDVAQQHKTAPDSTAVRVALWRAMHVHVDAAPHLVTDEFGLRLAAPADGWRERPDMDPRATAGFRASIVARARSSRISSPRGRTTASPSTSCWAPAWTRSRSASRRTPPGWRYSRSTSPAPRRGVRGAEIGGDGARPAVVDDRRVVDEHVQAAVTLIDVRGRGGDAGRIRDVESTGEDSGAARIQLRRGPFAVVQSAHAGQDVVSPRHQLPNGLSSDAPVRPCHQRKRPRRGHLRLPAEHSLRRLLCDQSRGSFNNPSSGTPTGDAAGSRRAGRAVRRRRDDAAEPQLASALA